MYIAYLKTVNIFTCIFCNSCTLLLSALTLGGHRALKVIEKIVHVFQDLKTVYALKVLKFQ